MQPRRAAPCGGSCVQSREARAVLARRAVRVFAVGQDGTPRGSGTAGQRGSRGSRATGAAGQQSVAAHAIGLGLYSSSRKYSDCCSTVTPLARRKARSSGT